MFIVNFSPNGFFDGIIYAYTQFKRLKIKYYKSVKQNNMCHFTCTSY